MKTITSAFEIGYTPSLEVIDQSPLYLDCVAGTPGFSRILPRLEGRLNGDQLHMLGEITELFGHVEACVTKAVAGIPFRVGGVEFVVSWEQVHRDAGVFSIRAAGTIASVSLMICRETDADFNEQPWHEMKPLLAFRNALGKFIPLESMSAGPRKLDLVTITRRPLLASVFWPPYTPTGDSTVRTIQLQMAYAFFHRNGEL